MIAAIMVEAKKHSDKLFGSLEKYTEAFERQSSSETRFVKLWIESSGQRISKHDYAALLLGHFTGDAHDHPLKGEPRELVKRKMGRHILEYLEEEVGHKPDYGLEDVYEDVIRGRFHEWLDSERSDRNYKLEPLEPEERDL